MSPLQALVFTGLLLLLISANNAAGQCSDHEDGSDLCSEMTVGVHITQEVEDKTSLQGRLITFVCEAEGSGQLSLQWNVFTEDDSIFPSEQMWVEKSQIRDMISSNLTLRALLNATIHCEVIQMLEEQKPTKVTSTGMLIILWPGQTSQPVPSQLTTVWATPTPLITGEKADAMIHASIIVATLGFITVLAILFISVVIIVRCHKCKKQGKYRSHVLSYKQASNASNTVTQEPANPEDKFGYSQSQPDVEKCSTQEFDCTPNGYTSYAYPRFYPNLTCIPAIASRMYQGQQGWPVSSSADSRRNSCENNVGASFITSQSESTTDSAYHSIVTESLTSGGAPSPCELYHGQSSMYHCISPIRCEKHQQATAMETSLSQSLRSTALEHLDIPNCTELGCPCQTERSSCYDSLVSYSLSHHRNSIQPVTDTRSKNVLLWNSHCYHSEDTGICMKDQGLKVLHPVELHTPLSVSSIPFMNHVEVITCDNSGGVYYNPVHDFSLKIPIGAIPEEMSISIEIGVTLYGPFQFPGEMKPVSPIVWLCVQEPHSFQFQKSVEVTLPHYLNIPSLKECESMKLTFLAANHNTKPNNDYYFKAARGQTNFEKQKSYATLTTSHFCFLCICAKLTSEYTKMANYCMITVQPENTQRSSWIIYFCVAYFLQTCIEAVREQFMSGSGYRITVKKFRFSPAGELEDTNLQINFQRAIPEGWVLALQSDNKISLADLDFWHVKMAELELMHKEGMYPPRFIVAVAGGDTSRVSSAKIQFMGAQENLDTEIPLNSVCTTENSRALALAASVSSLSIASGHSTPPPHRGFYPLMVSPGQSRSGWDLSNLPEDFPTDQELEEVTKEVMGKLQHDWPKLQAYLGIPDDVMLEIQCESTVRQRVRNMLKNWRQHGKDCSRLRLANCLNAADQRLHRTAAKLVAGEYLMDSPSSSNRSSSVSISSMERTLALTISDASSQSSNGHEFV